MEVRIAIDLSKCAGCRYCELWCSFFHDKVFSTSLSRIKIVRDDLIGMDYPIVCRHCLEAPYVSACPVGALYKDEQGIIGLNKDACSKCGSCAEACPYDAVSLNPFDGTPLICDLCGGNPICVRKCPTNALSLYPLTEITVAGPSMIGKRYRIAINEYKRLLEGWGVSVRYE